MGQLLSSALGGTHQNGITSSGRSRLRGCKELCDPDIAVFLSTEINQFDKPIEIPSELGQ